jgi:hypothetical protein
MKKEFWKVVKLLGPFFSAGLATILSFSLTEPNPTHFPRHEFPPSQPSGQPSCELLLSQTAWINPSLCSSRRGFSPFWFEHESSQDRIWFNIKRNEVHVGYDMGSNPLQNGAPTTPISNRRTKTLVRRSNQGSADFHNNWSSQRALGGAIATPQWIWMPMTPWKERAMHQSFRERALPSLAVEEPCPPSYTIG